MKKTILGFTVILLTLTIFWVLRPVRDVVVSSESPAEAQKVQVIDRDVLSHYRKPPMRLPLESERFLPFQVHSGVAEAPPWAIGYGREFWRRSADASELVLSSAGIPGNVNLGDIIERVSHAIRLNESGLPQINSRTYLATWDEATLRFSPKQYTGEVASPIGTDRQSNSQFNEDPTTEATFRTTAIRRGTEMLATSGSAPTPLSILGNTAQRALDHQARLLEHYETSEEGVEVTWIIQEAPAGLGPIEIEAELEGLNYYGESSKGALFADSTGTPRIFVGHVEFVDAAGSRGNLPLSVEGSRLRVEVPEQILAVTQFPLAIDPTIGPEFPVAPNSASEQKNPAIGSIGGEYLVAWTDTMSGNADIIAARVTANGELLDPNGITVWAGPGYQDVGSVAGWYSSGYVVVWQDLSNYNIYGAPVLGGVAGSRFDISTYPAIKGNPSIALATSPSKFLVAWIDYRYGSYSDIFGVLVAEPAGALPFRVQGSEFPISLGTYSQTQPKVAAAHTGFFVVWKDERAGSYSDIWGARVSQTGVVLDSSGIQLTSGGLEESTPSIAGFFDNWIGGQSYFVAWQDYRSGNADIWGRRIRVGGASCGSYCPDAEIPIVVLSGSGQGSPAVGHSDRHYLVAWQDGRNALTTGQDIYGATVYDPGTGGNVSVLEQPYVISNQTGDQLAPAVAGGGGHFLVGHQSYWNSSVPKIRANKIVTGN